ncbi:MAG TPA: hypothetical protein VGK34_05250, partial [Armatimonadota bacterium]
MKRSTKLILVCMILVFSFLTGFTYRDVHISNGPQGVLTALGQSPTKLVSALSDSIAGAGDGLSPVDTYWSVYSYLESKYYGSSTKDKQPTDKQITYAAIRGMLGALGDRYT